MKKLLSALALCSVLTASVVMTGCGEHEHTFEEAWTYDATYHWHKATCEHTDEKSDYAEHVYTNDYDVDCNTCGAVRLALVDLWDGTTAEVPTAVNGVISITTAEQLAGVAKKVNEGTTYAGVTIKLEANIDLNNKAWTPIGTSHRKTTENVKKFSGVFDGNYKHIFGLTNVGYVPADTREETAEFDIYNYGLFGYTENAEIKNLTVTANINCDAETLKGDSVAAIVGYANKGLNMQNCVVNGTINGGFDAAAGLVGRSYNATATEKLIIENCTNNATITSDFKSAGILGYVASNTYFKINNCVNTGSIKATGAMTDATHYSAYTSGIVNYSWNRTTEHTIIVIHNTNSGNIYNMDAKNNESGITNINSYAYIANTSSYTFTQAVTPHYDFTGNTNTGKVYVAGEEESTVLVSATSQLQPTPEFNCEKNID